MIKFIKELRELKIFSKIKKLPTRFGLLLIKLYQVCISPLFPSCCRFIPTCSEYGVIAIERFGLIKGGFLTIKRIIKCRPGSTYGYDPVPEKVIIKG